MGFLSLKKITGSEGLDLGGENAGLAALAAGAILGPAGYGLTAAQAGLATGGAMALATGSLQKGLMAGLGAYGGAGLSEGIMNLGASGAMQAANPQLTAGEIAREMGQEGFVKPGITDTLKSAGSAFMDKPMDALKTIGGGSYGQLAKYGLAATAPILAGSGVATTTALPSSSQYPGYIRPFEYNQRTGQLTPFSPVPTSRLYAEGGAVKPSDDGYVHALGGGFLGGIGDAIREQVSGMQSPVTTPEQPTQPAFRDPAGQSAIQQRLIDESQARFAQNQAAQQAAQQAVTTPFQAAPTTPAQAALTQAIASAPVAPAPTLTPMTGDSAAAYNYLMGQSPYPYATQDKEVFRPYTDILAQKATTPQYQPMRPVTPPTTTQSAGAGGGGGGGGGGIEDAATLAALGGGAYAAGMFGGGGNYAPVVDMDTYSPAFTPAPATAADIESGAAVGDLGGTINPYQPLGDAAIEDMAAKAIASQGVAYPGGAAELAVHANSLGAPVVTGAELEVAKGMPGFAELAVEYGPYVAAAYILDNMTDNQISDAIGNLASDVGGAAEDVVSGIGNAVSSFFGGFGWAKGGEVEGLSMKPTISTSNQLGRMLDDDLMDAYERATQSGDAGKARAYKAEIDYRARNPSRMATGGISDAHYNLGGYSDGGRLLRGPGDGVSDDIPATIGRNKQPARLADGEFVVPARIVSELGNGSTEAGARKLYAMMDRIQSARRKTVGKGKVARNTRADKYLPA